MNAQSKIEPAPGVYQAIAAVQGELATVGIAKTRRNTQGSGYNFRGIDDVYAALSPLLAKHHLVVVPRVTQREVIERQSKSGGALFYVTVHAEFDFVSALDGTTHTAATFGEAMDSGDKATNKAMSAAYKYAAFMTFAIPTEGDNDADATTHEVIVTHEPATREKLDGPHTSKTALKAAITKVVRQVEAAQSVEIIDAIKEEHKHTINQARRDWPELIDGNPNVPEDIGLKGTFAKRRDELTPPAESIEYQMLCSCVDECRTSAELQAFLTKHGDAVGTLDGEESRLFEERYDARVEALKNPTPMEAGAFGG